MWDTELRLTLQRMERKLDAIMRAMALEHKHERDYEMATSDTLSRLQADLKSNTDATASTQAALEHYASVNADLTQQLKDSIAASADDDVLKGIADQMEANTKALTDAAPATAAAVVANTAAAPAAA